MKKKIVNLKVGEIWFFIFLLLALNLSCFVEPKKNVWLQPKYHEQLLIFDNLVKSVKKVKKFKRDQYYIIAIEVENRDTGDLIWQCSLLPFRITSPKNVNWDYSEMTELPEKLEYGQLVQQLEKRVSPDILMPGIKYDMEITVLAMDNDKKNQIHFWIRSHFEVEIKIFPINFPEKNK